MALRPEVIDLIRPAIVHDLGHETRISKVVVMEEQSCR